MWTRCRGDELGLEGAGSAWPSTGGTGVGTAPSIGTAFTAPLLPLRRMKLSLKHSDVGTFQVSYP